jgi:hypothetical protein
MLDTDTFVTTLYVLVDDFCRARLPADPPRRGPAPALSRSEVLALSLFGQLRRFASESDFWRFARCRLRPLFPTLPCHSQYNRALRRHQEALVALSHHVVELLGSRACPYEALDRFGVAARWCGRRGAGWMPEAADVGYCSRLGFFQGFGVLTCVAPDGAVTGFAVAPASAKDQPLADAFLNARRNPRPDCPFAGQPALSGDYLGDRGFCGSRWRERWLALGANVICPPQGGPGKRPVWPPELFGWHAGLRQVVETVHRHLLDTFRLERERPHELRGFFARLSAKIALHNVCIWLNRRDGRNDLAFARLLDW